MIVAIVQQSLEDPHLNELTTAVLDSSNRMELIESEYFGLFIAICNDPRMWRQHTLRFADLDSEYEVTITPPWFDVGQTYMYRRTGKLPLSLHIFEEKLFGGEQYFTFYFGWGMQKDIYELSEGNLYRLLTNPDSTDELLKQSKQM